MTYSKHDGRQHMGIDAQGRDVWRLRGRVNGVAFDERYHGGKREAGHRLTELKKQAQDGRLPAAGSETVAALVERYIEHQIGLGKLRKGQPATTYRGYFRNHVPPGIAHMQFRAVRPKDLQSVIDAMMAKGRAASSVRQLGALLHGSFDLALHQRDIAINPMDGVMLPKAQRSRLTPPDASATKAILQAADEDYRVPLAISAMTGLRRGEVCALRWADLRSNDQGDYVSLHVDGTLQRVDGSLERMPPKTDRGYRDVPLPTSLSSMLRSHRKEQAERRLLLGEAWADDDVLTDRGDGRPMDPDALSKAFRSACKRAKVTGVRLHDLRHAWATMQVGAGVDIATVSQAIGHSTPGFTMAAYIHPNEEMTAPLATAAETALGEALGKL
jgi:integrase